MIIDPLGTTTRPAAASPNRRSTSAMRGRSPGSRQHSSNSSRTAGVIHSCGCGTRGVRPCAIATAMLCSAAWYSSNGRRLVATSSTTMPNDHTSPANDGGAGGSCRRSRAVQRADAWLRLNEFAAVDRSAAGTLSRSFASWKSVMTGSPCGKRQ